MNKHSTFQILRWIFIFVLLMIPEICLTVRSASGEMRVTDRTGKEIRSDKPFQRIISLYGAHTENLFQLGLDKEIIGVSRHESYPPEAMKKPAFSPRDDVEKFFAARPDLVLVRPMITRAYPKLIGRLEKSGITVISLQPGSLSEMYDYWMDLGKISGREKQAENMVKRFKQAVLEFRAISAGIRDRKRVYFEAIHSKMKTFTPGAMAMFVLETAGGINMAKDAKQVRTTNIAYYGKERIMVKGSKIDVFLSQTGSMNAITAEMIKNETGFQTIKAVRDNEIYLVNEKIVSRPTFRLLVGIYRIGSILYPDRFRISGKQILEKAGCDLK